MAIDGTDIVLTPAGSGDAAFAFLEKAAIVFIADNNLRQLAHLRERLKKLAQGDFEGFLAVEEFGLCDGLCYGKIDIEKASWNGYSTNLESFGPLVDGERTKIARRLEFDPHLGNVYGTR